MQVTPAVEAFQPFRHELNNKERWWDLSVTDNLLRRDGISHSFENRECLGHTGRDVGLIPSEGAAALSRESRASLTLPGEPALSLPNGNPRLPKWEIHGVKVQRDSKALSLESVD